MEVQGNLLFAGCAAVAMWRLLRRYHVGSCPPSRPIAWLPRDWPAAPASAWEEVTEETARAVSLLTVAPPIVRSLDEVPHTVIETAAALRAVVARLRTAPAVAVDIEHSPASFHGHVCTLQLSTVDEDIVIDCLVPEVRAALPDALRDICWSPHIVKVLHSASNDARWLSSNFGLQLRCMIDTGIIAKLLHQALTATIAAADADSSADADAAARPAATAVPFPRDSSLAALLMHYFAFRSDKRFQRADWRIRPLPAEMLRYARSDTRYLLPLAQKMLHDLFAANAAAAAICGSVAGATAGAGEGSIDAAPASTPESLSSPQAIIADVLRRSSAIAQARYSRADRERFIPASALDCARGRVAPALHTALAAIAGHGACSPAPAAGSGGGAAGAASSGSAEATPALAAAALAEQRCALLFCCFMAARHAIGLAEDSNPELLADRDSLLAAAATATLLMVQPKKAHASASDGTTLASLPADAALDHPLVEHALGAWAASMRHAAAALIRWNSPSSLDMGTMLRLLQLFGVGRVAVDGAGLVTVLEADAAAAAGAGDAEADAAAAAALIAASSSGAAASRPSREARKAARADNIFVPRAAPLYNNIALLAPDGTLIAKIDRRRAQWYVDVGLVVVLSPDEPAAAPARSTGGGADGDDEDHADTADGADDGADEDEEDIDALVDERQRQRKAAAAVAMAGQTASAGASKAKPKSAIDINEVIAASGDPSEPLRLRMKRAPRGPGHAGDEFHLSEKRNECVICGVTWEEAAAAFGGLNRSFIGESRSCVLASWHGLAALAWHRD